MNTFESVLVRCITLEPATQSEVNQKERNIYCRTHTHTHTRKSTSMVLTYLFAEQNTETQTWTQQEGEVGQA